MRKNKRKLQFYAGAVKNYVVDDEHKQKRKDYTLTGSERKSFVGLFVSRSENKDVKTSHT